MKTKRQEANPPPLLKTTRKPLYKYFEDAPSSRAPLLGISLPNPMVQDSAEEVLEEEKAPLAEVVPIGPPKPTAKAEEDDERVAYQAWLEAFASFPDYLGFQINRMPQHRVERKRVVKKDGTVHIKRVHVLKEYVSELLPGDHFGDPSGRRHQTKAGYPTREHYEKIHGQSQYHRKIAKDSPRLVVSNDSQYKGPHWSPKMSKQRVTEGCEKFLRPPSFAEILQMHWDDVYQWSNVVCVEHYRKMKNGEIVVSFHSQRDASVWGPTLCPGRPDVPAPLELVSQSECVESFEILNDPEVASNDSDFSQYASPITKLEQDLMTGRELVWAMVTDDGKADYHQFPVGSRIRTIANHYNHPAPAEKPLSDVDVIFDRFKARNMMLRVGLDPDRLPLPPSQKIKRLEAADKAFQQWLHKPTLLESLQRQRRLEQKLQMEQTYVRKAWMKYEKELEARREPAYARASYLFFKSIPQVVVRPFLPPKIDDDEARYHFWWQAIELSSHANRYAKWLMDKTPSAPRVFDPFEKVIAHWEYQAACKRITREAFVNIGHHINAIRKANNLSRSKKVIPDYVHRDPPLGDMNLGMNDKLDILSEKLCKSEPVDIGKYLKDPCFVELASLEKQRALFEIEEEIMGPLTPQDFKLQKGLMTERERDSLLSSFGMSVNSPLLLPKGNISPTKFKTMLGIKPEPVGVIGKIARIWKYLD